MAAGNESVCYKKNKALKQHLQIYFPEQIYSSQDFLLRSNHQNQ